MRHLLLVLALGGCGDRSPLTNPERITDCHLDSDCDVFDVCDCDRCFARNKNVHVQLCPGAPCKAEVCAGKRAVCVEGSCAVEKR